MNPLDRLAEQRLAEAIAAGGFDELAGAGKPLALEDLSGVPEDLRAGYLLLKGANVLPEEMQIQKELLSIGGLLRACEEAGARASLEERQRALLLRHEILMERLRRRR